MTNTSLENLDMSLDDLMVGNDDFNWDFFTDVNNANTSEQDNAGINGLFSMPSDSPPADVLHAGQAPTMPTQADDLSWLNDALRTPAADQQAVSFPAAPAPEPEYLLNYPDLETSFQSHSSPYFAVPQQNSVVTSFGFHHIHFAEPTTTQAAPLSTSPPLALRQLAAPAKRTSVGREQIRRRSSNSTTSDEYTAALPSKVFTAEKPQYDPKHPWRRINLTTRGVTKRSGKINQYDAEKMYKQDLQNTFDTWRSPNYKFDYHKHGELAKLEYSANAIKEFIYHHPLTTDSKLRLWIQKTPADSSGRYPSLTLAKCRFSECPSRKANLNGTIWTGHIRVAVDERSQKYKDKTDPFFMAGYFHLYCFEKFLDLPEICLLPNVEVLADMRQLANEPNMKWSASLSTAKEGIVAQRFIESCRKGRSQIRDFPHYPRPQHMVPGADKPHEHTLNYRMQRVKEGDRARSSKESLSKRPQRATQVNVNFGDLEMACRAKLAMRKPQPALQPRAKRRQRTSSWTSQADDGDYVSEAEAPERKRKKRRVAEATMGPSSPAAAQSANTDEPFGSASYPVYAWPQYTSDAAAATHQISSTAFLDDPANPFAPTFPPPPDHPPLARDPVVTHSVTIPSSYTLTDFTLANPTKRSAPSDDDHDDQGIASRVLKRQRRSSSALSVRFSPTSNVVVVVRSPPGNAASARRTSSRSSSAFSPLRRSSRLGSSASVAVAGVDNGRRRSPRGVAGSLGSGGSSVGSLGSLGSLFG